MSRLTDHPCTHCQAPIPFRSIQICSSCKGLLLDAAQSERGNLTVEAEAAFVQATRRGLTGEAVWDYVSALVVHPSKFHPGNQYLVPAHVYLHQRTAFLNFPENQLYLNGQRVTVNDVGNGRALVMIATEENRGWLCDWTEIERAAAHPTRNLTPSLMESWEIDIPEYLNLDLDEAEGVFPDYEYTPPTPEERAAAVDKFLNEFKGPNPNPKDDVIQSFLGLGDFPAVRRWQEQRDARRERIEELRRRAYYQASLTLRFFREHSEWELEQIIIGIQRPITDQEVAFANVTYREAYEHLKAKA